MDLVTPDARRTLDQVQESWNECTRCELGERRERENQDFVFGEGASRGILFIGGSPGPEEEEVGRPFAGAGGRLLRFAIKELGISDNSYLTSITNCRSCGQAYDNEGQPRYRKDYRSGNMLPIIIDEPPNTECLAACSPRMYEEIYLVDPVIIVALGAAAASAMTRRPLSIQAVNGSPTSIKIPGAGVHAVLTEKKKLWMRKVRGEVVMPTAQNEVEYLMVPLLDPSFVLRKNHDARWKNPLQTFTEGLKRAVMIYDRYMFEVHGDHTPGRELHEGDLKKVMENG